MTILFSSIVLLISSCVTMTLAIPSVLVYTRTAGFRHDSIPTAIQSLRDQGPSYNISFSFSEDPSLFTDDGLQGFDGIMFVSNSDEVLDTTGKTALASWLDKGGNFMAVHAGCACLFEEDFFMKEVGALFDYHPDIEGSQQATFLPLNKTHPAMTMVPDRWTFAEEVYHFRSDPRSVGAVVLMTVDEDSYEHTGSSTGNYPPMGDPHPIAWYQERGAAVEDTSAAGRSFFTSLGHTNETWQNATFLDHVMQGLVWTLGSEKTLAFSYNGKIGNATRAAPSTSASASSLAVASEASSTSAGSTSIISPASSSSPAAAAATPSSTSGASSGRTASLLGLTGGAVAALALSL